MRPKEARNLAYSQMDKINFQWCENPLDTFASIEFRILVSQSVNQAEFAKLNLALDPRGCIGRTAIIAAIMEQHFPELNLEYGEILIDYFREVMLEKLGQKPELAKEPTFISELLMYEEPHGVVAANETIQFEPLSKPFGKLVNHPEIKALPLWEALAASVSVSEAWLKDDPHEKMSILLKAEDMCPGLPMISENMIESLSLMGKTDEAIELAKQCLQERFCARTLFLLYGLTEGEAYYQELVKKYTIQTFEYFIGDVFNDRG